MKHFEHNSFPGRRESLGFFVKLFGWKIGLGFWMGPKRHFLVRDYKHQWWTKHRGIQIYLSRLTLATLKDK